MGPSDIPDLTPYTCYFNSNLVFTLYISGDTRSLLLSVSLFGKSVLRVVEHAMKLLMHHVLIASNTDTPPLHGKYHESLDETGNLKPEILGSGLCSK